MNHTVFELTKEEKKKLNAALTGYGRLEYAAKKSGLHKNTLRIVRFRGTGTAETIKTIRENILSDDKLKTVSK